MTKTMLVLYTCAECSVCELLAEIIPKKTCDLCGKWMQAEEFD